MEKKYKSEADLDVQASNRLIAEFMNLDRCTDPDHFSDRCYSVPYAKGYHRGHQLQHHSSWDWLMPVWKKLGGIMYEARNTLNKEEYGNANILTIQILKSLQKVDIESAFGFIVDGVKWYNNLQIQQSK